MRLFISFDFDRTLADYSRAHGNSILDGIHETFDNKFWVNWFDIHASGYTDLQIITQLVHNHGVSMHQIFGRMNLCVSNVVQHFPKYSYEYPVELLDGAEKTLSNLFAMDDVVLGLSTGNIKAICLDKTKSTGIDQYFSFGSYGDEVFTRHQLLRLTRKRLKKYYGFSAHDIGIHIGDSALDVVSAKTAGFIPIGLASGNYSKEVLSKFGAKYVFKNINELSRNLDDLISDITNNTVIKTTISSTVNQSGKMS